jgi:hypothetical protein
VQWRVAEGVLPRGYCHLQYTKLSIFT